MTRPALTWSMLAWVVAGVVLLAVALVLVRSRVVRFAVRQSANAALACDHGSAAHWLSVARALGERDPAVLMEHAWHLARLDRTDAALAAYRLAARALPTDVGDAEYAAARVLAMAGRLEEAEDALARAVARDATVLQDLRHDDDLAALEGRPRFDAWRRG